MSRIIKGLAGKCGTPAPRPGKHAPACRQDGLTFDDLDPYAACGMVTVFGCKPALASA